MKGLSKKTIILFVLRILYAGSSKNRPVKPKVITNVINDLGIEVSIRTIQRNIGYLIKSGMPIYQAKNRNDGYYYEKNEDFYFKT